MSENIKNRCTIDYGNKCDCREDDNCGCTFPQNCAQGFDCPDDFCGCGYELADGEEEPPSLGILLSPWIDENFTLSLDNLDNSTYPSFDCLTEESLLFLKHAFFTYDTPN